MNEENEPKRTVKMFDILPPLEKKEEAEVKEEILEKEIEVEEVVLPEYVETEIKETPLEIKEEPIFPEGLFISKAPKNKKKFFIISGIIILVLVGLVSYFTFSKAEVVIKPKTESMQFKTDLSLDKNIAFIDLESNKIPAQFFQVEKEGQKEFPATQERDVQEKARGIIIVYNQYSSAPQTLVKGTRFVSEKEKLFRTIETIVIPGAQIEEGKIISSSINVPVEAAEPGKDYNIGPSTFTIPGFKGTPKYTGFTGKSDQPMAGGVIGKVKVVTANDIQAAKDILAVELKKIAKDDLERRIPSDLKILKETSIEDVLESSSSVEADQPAEKFTVKIKVVAKVLGFSENDAISLINSNLKEKISEDKAVIPNTIKINYTIIDVNLEKGTAKLSCDVNEDLAWEVDVDQIRKDLAGKNELEVRQYLTSHSEIESAKVIFWPFWVKKIPSKENKIKITVD